MEDAEVRVYILRCPQCGHEEEETKVTPPLSWPQEYSHFCPLTMQPIRMDFIEIGGN